MAASNKQPRNNSPMVNHSADYALNLLRGQMAGRLMSGDFTGLSLNEYVLGRPARRSGKDMLNDALTGLMRSDAALLRQGAQNLVQGRALLETGGAALEDMTSVLKRMREIVALAKPSGSTTALDTEYASLSAQLASVINGTSFNGLKLFDGQTWDDRVNSSGATGKLTLQAGHSQNELTLYDLGGHKGHGIADLAPSQISSTEKNLEDFEGQVLGIQEAWKARTGLLGMEKTTLERQAAILQEATDRVKSDGQQSLRDLLLEILLREQGSVADGRI